MDGYPAAVASGAMLLPRSAPVLPGKTHKRNGGKGKIPSVMLALDAQQLAAGVIDAKLTMCSCGMFRSSLQSWGILLSSFLVRPFLVEEAHT